MPENKRELTPTDVVIATMAAKELGNLAVITVNAVNEDDTGTAKQAAALYKEGKALLKELMESLAPGARKQLLSTIRDQ